MKLVFMLLANVVFVQVAKSGQVVLAERMVRFTFNHGLLPLPYVTECTDEEYRYIDPLFDISTTVRKRYRNLRQSAAASAPVHEEEFELRELTTYPGKCKNYCAGMARGTCRASGCVGYRRSLQASQPVGNLTCAEQLNEIHNALDALIVSDGGKLLSVPCQRFIRKAARKSECFDDVVYGEVTGFTFFTVSREMTGLSLPGTSPIVTKLRENAPNGYSICNTIPFNIEIEVNPCVNMVNITVTGTNNFMHNRFDKVHPMSVFENATTTSGSGINQGTFPYGVRYLDPGSYTIRAQPDNFLYKEKTLEFTVFKCS